MEEINIGVIDRYSYPEKFIRNGLQFLEPMRKEVVLINEPLAWCRENLDKNDFDWEWVFTPHPVFAFRHGSDAVLFKLMYG
jgi:hypothetical protein